MIKYEGKFFDKNHFQKVHISRGGGVKANSEKVHTFFLLFFTLPLTNIYLLGVCSTGHLCGVVSPGGEGLGTGARMYSKALVSHKVSTKNSF